MQFQKTKTILICFVAVFIIGFIGGFYLALYLQNQVVFLTIIVVIFAFLTWLGSGAELVGFLRDWYREQREKPQLSIEYDKNKKQSTFSPELQQINIQDRKIISTRKYLKVRVKNSGGIARNCKAELTGTPSEEPKCLIWGREEQQIDIGAINGHAILNVVFSDSILDTIPNNNIHAFVSTKETLYSQGFYPSQDGFEIGEYEIEITVISEDGSSTQSKFKIHVDKDFRKLSMERIS